MTSLRALYGVILVAYLAFLVHQRPFIIMFLEGDSGGGTLANTDSGCKYVHRGAIPNSEDVVVWNKWQLLVSAGDLAPILSWGQFHPDTGAAVVAGQEDETKTTVTGIYTLHARTLALKRVPLINMPDNDAPFRPHGLHADHMRGRVYAVSHGMGRHGSRVVVFDAVEDKIVGGGGGGGGGVDASSNSSSSSSSTTSSRSDGEGVSAAATATKDDRHAEVEVTALRYVRSVILPRELFSNGALNDVVALADNEVLVTRFLSAPLPPAGRAYPSGWRQLLNRILSTTGYLGTPLHTPSAVIRCSWPDGSSDNDAPAKCNVAASSHYGMNGITASADGKLVFVAEVFARRLAVFARNGSSLKAHSYIQLPHLPDNVAMDANSGCLVAAGVRDMRIAAKHLHAQSRDAQRKIPTPSAVMVACPIKLDDGSDSWRVRTAVGLAGERIPMVSSAAALGSRFFIGSATSSGVAVCPTKPLDIMAANAGKRRAAVDNVISTQSKADLQENAAAVRQLVARLPQICNSGDRNGGSGGDDGACGPDTPAAYSLGDTGKWPASKANSHVPRIAFHPNDEDWSVRVYIDHPQHDMHVIGAVWLVDTSNNDNETGSHLPLELKRLPLNNAGAPQVVRFKVPNFTSEIMAYAWCNKHGIWRSDAVAMPTWMQAQVAALPQVCSGGESDVCGPNTPPAYTASAPGTWPTTKAISHAPIITSFGSNDDRTSVTLIVAHGQSPAHHIGAIWLTDLQGDVVAFKYLDKSPTQSQGQGKTKTVEEAAAPPPRVAKLWLPSRVKEVVPYSWCNLHGVWRGAATVSPAHYDDVVAAIPQMCANEAGLSVYCATDSGGASNARSDESSTSTTRTSKKAVPYSSTNLAPWDNVEKGHTPVAVLNGTLARVTLTHGQSEYHHIGAVWLVDDADKVVGYTRLPATAASAPVVVDINVAFTGGALPDAVTPLAWCNLHGIWRGKRVTKAA